MKWRQSVFKQQINYEFFAMEKFRLGKKSQKVSETWVWDSECIDDICFLGFKMYLYASQKSAGEMFFINVNACDFTELSKQNQDRKKMLFVITRLMITESFISCRFLLLAAQNIFIDNCLFLLPFFSSKLYFYCFVQCELIHVTLNFSYLIFFIA